MKHWQVLGVAFGATMSMPLLAQEQQSDPKPAEDSLEVAPIPSQVSTVTRPPRTVSPIKSPTPRNNPGRWIGPNDYPPYAMRAEIEGLVSVAVTVGANGRVSDCQITRSSGDKILDETTCKLIFRRARFNPAQNRSGTAITGKWWTSVRWVMPDIMPSEMKESGLIFSYLVDTDGTVSDCRVEHKSGKARPENPCHDVPENVAMIRRDGGPAKVRVRYTRTVEYELVD